MLASATNRQDGADAAAVLVDLAQRLSRELHPSRRHANEAGLDSSLDRDLGFDSLARVELFLRVERTFGVSLPEQLLASAETLRELWAALSTLAGRVETGLSSRIEHPSPEHPEAAPHDARTLLEVLDWHLHAHCERVHVHLDAGGELQAFSYAALHEGAQAAARALMARGLERGQTIGIMLPTSVEYLYMFVGALLAGAIPVPLYPPARASQVEEHLRRQARILENAGARFLVTTEEIQPLGVLLRSIVGGLAHVVSTEDLCPPSGFAKSDEAVARPGSCSLGVATTDDVALLQYTSGSTGDPKGVVLSHANLLANLRAMGKAADVTAADVAVSWLPLYHDMGLIGAWLGSLYYGCPLVLMSPLRFLARPARWLWAIAAHRGTLSAAPNFAYELCVSKVSDDEIAGLDLSAWRMALNGAEHVSSSTVKRFCARFAAYGFRTEAMAPVYGLAECSVGLAFPPLGRGPLVDRVVRQVLRESGTARPAAASDALAVELVSSGRPLPQHEVRVVDQTGRELAERREGRLQFRGPSATRGYFRNPAETARLFDGDWLESGDLAYIAEGDIYITGRSKDIIIRAGRHIYPQEVEDAVGRIEGLRKGCVAVFGGADPQLGTERVVVLVETKATESEARERLRRQIRATATDLMGLPPDDVVLAPPRTVLKTSSGKIRRAACRQAYESRQLARGARGVRWQLARLAWFGGLARIRRSGNAIAATIYAAYMWLLLCTIVPWMWSAAMLLPTLGLRWAAARAASRVLLALSGTKLEVEGATDFFAGGAGVIVCNHTSYFDGLAMLAALPKPVRFVVKAELARSWLSRLPLNRLNVHYVERTVAAQGISDAQRARELLRESRPLLFFPEGTLTRVPGLRAFHMGAFVAAAESGVPLVPMVIHGTRSMLRDGAWFPRRGAIHVQFGPSVTPVGQDFAAALKLRAAARAWMLAHCGEPDLAAEQAPD